MPSTARRYPLGNFGLCTSSVIAWRALAKSAVQRFGRIDALINNAYYHGPMGDDVSTTDFTNWPEQFNTNVFGTPKMSHAVLPQMKQQKGGAIVMINTMGA